jgi:hypothetical protein
MNYFRTMLLLAAMTALFMGVGYLIGGQGGLLIALSSPSAPTPSPGGTPTRWCCACTMPSR